MSQVLALLLLSLSINCFAGIGTITEERGSGEITRGKAKISAKKDGGIESMDTVETVNGVVGITFQDDTKVRVTEHSKLLIDDFVYDPKAKGAGKLAMKVALGTVRYASGAVAKENAKNVAINTPTASIAVRGTAFSMTVNEVGDSTIILLPNVDGTVGEIEVKTGAGAVVLNRAFQATVTTNSEVKPLKPVLLALSESAIDNMLIVSPPKEVLKQIVQETNSKADALSFNALDINALDIKPFVNPLNFNALDVNQLDQTYLGNAFDNLDMNTFAVGYNSTSNIYIFDKDWYWQVERHVGGQNVVLMVNKDRGYNISLTQNNTTINIKNQDSTTNNIIIKQSK
jgi:FecR protein